MNTSRVSLMTPRAAPRQLSSRSRLQRPWDLELDDDALERIIRHRPHLEAVDIRFCPKITSRGIRELSKLEHLRSARLSGLRFDDSSLLALAACRQLSVLHLVMCPDISVAGVQALVPRLACLTSLEVGCGAQ